MDIFRAPRTRGKKKKGPKFCEKKKSAIFALWRPCEEGGIFSKMHKIVKIVMRYKEMENIPPEKRAETYYKTPGFSNLSKFDQF